MDDSVILLLLVHTIRVTLFLDVKQSPNVDFMLMPSYFGFDAAMSGLPIASMSLEYTESPLPPMTTNLQTIGVQAKYEYESAGSNLHID